MVRRLIDLIVTGAGLIVLSPILILIAIAVKIDSPGPVLFRQTRAGLNNRPFEIFKFRSMRHDDNAGPRVTAGGDKRITSVGVWLRRFKLDELPQLLNVFAGDMSLVGPRPEVPEYVALWGDDARAEILSVKPGMTDPVTVKFRNEETILANYADPERAYRDIVLPEKVRMYRDYVRTRSCWSDIKVIAATAAAIVMPANKSPMKP
ncbi:MAG: sugar transferase [Rhodobacteraceae bacterium]|nr:sugar transferase [Paracoccaceae bacterium]